VGSAALQSEIDQNRLALHDRCFANRGIHLETPARISTT
jgi:hypothetical protein